MMIVITMSNISPHLLYVCPSAILNFSRFNAHTYKQGARTLFEGLFENLSDLSDLAAPMVDVSEESKTVFLVWRCPASGFLDATDTFVINDETKKIYRQNVAYRTG